MATAYQIRLAEERDRASIRDLMATTRQEAAAVAVLLHGATLVERDVESDAVGWPARPGDVVFVAELAGTAGAVVGLSVLRQLGAGEWWIVALYVRPDQRRQGIGQALQQQLIAHANTQGVGLIRQAVPPWQHGLRRLAEADAKHGQFAAVGRYQLYQANALPCPPEMVATLAAFEPVSSTAADLAGVNTFLAESRFFIHAQQSVQLPNDEQGSSAPWVAVSEERLRQWADAGQIFTWHGIRHRPNAPDGVMIVAANAPIGTLTLAYLDAQTGYVADICRAVRRFAGARGFRTLRHRFLTLPERLVAIEQGGWRRPYPVSLDEVDLVNRPLTGV